MIIKSLVGACKRKDREIIVTRDQHGKFYVAVDGVETQKKLNAKEIVCYMLHAANDEI